MKLSVVIVNYNVKYFLEQCLHSVQKAVDGIEAEVFVVDNNSVDGSNEMVRKKFPKVKLIENKDNRGFSRANNQAIRISTGEYVLLLNPDTVVEDDTFSKIIAFMDAHPDAGGLGVKMVDGKGKFLPESKRGLPTPDVAFYKIFGLSKLFPKSKTFGKYHLSFLDRNEIHEVEILSGAFMFMRREALEKAGLLDEAFFMYGEDIDLSYRLIQAGYKNFYFPKTRIIHYKGESTKKSSVNYVVTFYRAMIIFARKHFSQKNARLFSFLINFAVYFRASLAIINRFFYRAFLPIIDLVLLFGGIYFIKDYWEHLVIFPRGGSYPEEVMYIHLPAYILIWIFAVFLSGGYDKPIRLKPIFQGLFWGTVTILVIYSLLPESVRFSRAIIILGAIWGLIAMPGIRYLLHILKIKDVRIGSEQKKRFLIVGKDKEPERVAELLRSTYMNPGFIGIVTTSKEITGKNGFIGHIDQIEDIINIYKINEVVFCSRDLPAREIIDKMSELHQSQVEYKIAPQESLSIIGSNSINTSGDLYIIDINSINKIQNRRNKRFLDVLLCISLLTAAPILIFVVEHPVRFIKNLFLVLSGKYSWIGYAEKGSDTKNLPPIKKGILGPPDAFRNRKFDRETIDNLNLLYARDYKTVNDINIMYKGIRHLGRKHDRL